MAISRAQLLKELLPGLNALFGLTYKTYEEEHKEIFEIETSERSFEDEVKLSGFSSAPVKNEGSAISYDNAQEVWSARYTHETIALGFSITEEAMEDNLYDSLSARYTKSLARAMAYTKQVKGASVLNNAFAASGYTGGDGVTLCATNHPTVAGGVNSNRPTTGADLNETSLEAAVIQIAAWTDERGLLIAARPKKLIIPPALMFVATRILQPALHRTASCRCASCAEFQDQSQHAQVPYDHQGKAPHRQRNLSPCHLSSASETWSWRQCWSFPDGQCRHQRRRSCRCRMKRTPCHLSSLQGR